MKQENRNGSVWSGGLPALITLIVLTSAPCLARSGAETVAFTTGAAKAVKFGTHEVVLTGNGRTENPFQTAAVVMFTPPSGKTVTVNAFYDGGNTWRARVYVTETGAWR